MTLKQILTAIVFTLTGISLAGADTLGFRAGGGIWQPDSSGTFRHGTDNFDLKNDLHYKDGENQNYVYAFFEHPIPIIPNIRVSQTSLTFDGTGTVGAGSHTFGSTDFAGAAVTSKMVLDHTDATIYYSLLDNWFNLDLGITAKKFAGKVTVSDGTTTETTNLDKTIPLLYVAAGIELPFVNNLFVGIETNVLSIGDNIVRDITTKISYTTGYFIGFEVGIRTFSMELDNLNGNYSNMEFTGSFANLYIHF